MNRWNGSQSWKRDRTTPCLALGAPGAFDDAHIFAPCVADDDGVFKMWYCGSRGDVADRVFKMGLATSTDGIRFVRHPRSPVLAAGIENRSVLTPTLLRHPDGSLCRENGDLRLWFAACTFPDGDGRHTLHDTTSRDGLDWTPPSDAQLQDVYAPTIIKEHGVYRMWYTDVAEDPWSFRYAESRDGCQWNVVSEPVLTLDQPWEHGRLFYPTVLRVDDRHLMWYGSSDLLTSRIYSDTNS